MKSAIIEAAKVFGVVFLIFGLMIVGGVFISSVSEEDCVKKGVFLNTEVKFYHNQCYVKGYSHGD